MLLLLEFFYLQYNDILRNMCFHTFLYHNKTITFSNHKNRQGLSVFYIFILWISVKIKYLQRKHGGKSNPQYITVKI